MLSSESVVMATFFGIFVPFIAALLPIRRALTNNLHDALDQRRTNRAKIPPMTVERHGSSLPSASMLFIGMFLSVLGFVIYYLLPKSLLLNDTALLFNLFLAILILMLLGLVMLALNVQPLLERVLVFIFLSIMMQFENRSLSALVVNNLIAHRTRNRKTSIMYALSLGFIIFLSAVVQSQLRSLVYDELSKNDNCHLTVTTNGFRDTTQTLHGLRDVNTISTFLDYDSSATVSDFGFVSFELASIDANTVQTSATNFGRIHAKSVNIYAISANVLNIAGSYFLSVGSQDNRLASLYSLSEQLYTVKGSYSAVVGGYFQSFLGLRSLQDPFLIQTYSSSSPGQQQAVFNAVTETIAFMNSVPVFLMNSLPSSSGQSMVVSIPTFMEMSAGNITSVRNLPIERVFVRTVDGLANEGVDSVYEGLAKLLMADSTIYDDRSKLASLASTSALVSSIFNLVTLVALIVAFFSLNSSMVTNILEQTKEIGILRALGLTRFAIFRLYIYEAFILIFSAGILGTFIGIVVGWSMSAQLSIMANIPIQLYFPFNLFGLVSLVSLICSVLATLSPIIKTVFNRTVVSIIRG